MCDTFLAAPNATADRIMLFAKNSDRDRREAQAVEITQGADHAAGATLACTYITIPQARRTHGALLCRPHWMWGAEMGVNEHGVAIGNEALFARAPSPETPALLGMDLLRLGLERAATAAEAVDVITALLEQFGQGGNCSLGAISYYHNSFLIADHTDAFVLETMDRHWVVERVRDVRAISNVYTIGRDASRTSAGLDAHIRAQGWSAGALPNYEQSLCDHDRSASGSTRFARSTSLLEAAKGQVRLADMMRGLRDHGPEAEGQPGWRPLAAARTVCAHASDEKPRGHSVGSLVSELHANGAVHWVTASASPCVSIFKPVLLDVPLPSMGATLTGDPDIRSFWWRHDRLQRALLDDTSVDLASLRKQRDDLEGEFTQRITRVLAGSDAHERSRVVKECWADAMALEETWLALVKPALSQTA